MKNLRKERKSVSYQPLGLEDVTSSLAHHVLSLQKKYKPMTCSIGSTCSTLRWLALSVLPVPHWDGFELHGRPPLAHHVPSLWIFDQPINLPLKLLLLGQVDVLRLIWLYRSLQHLRVVQQMLLQDKKLSLNTTNITTNGAIHMSSIRQWRQGGHVWWCPLSLFMLPYWRQC
jgi:hypothetical protein